MVYLCIAPGEFIEHNYYESIGEFIPQEAFHGGWVEPHEGDRGYVVHVVFAGPFETVDEAQDWWDEYWKRRY